MFKFIKCSICVYDWPTFFQTNGTSSGLAPVLRVYNNTARYVDQGGNKVRDVNFLFFEN